MPGSTDNSKGIAGGNYKLGDDGQYRTDVGSLEFPRDFDILVRLASPEEQPNLDRIPPFTAYQVADRFVRALIDLILDRIAIPPEAWVGDPDNKEEDVWCIAVLVLVAYYDVVVQRLLQVGLDPTQVPGQVFGDIARDFIQLGEAAAPTVPHKRDAFWMVQIYLQLLTAIYLLRILRDRTLLPDWSHAPIEAVAHERLAELRKLSQSIENRYLKMAVERLVTSCIHQLKSAYESGAVYDEQSWQMPGIYSELRSNELPDVARRSPGQTARQAA